MERARHYLQSLKNNKIMLIAAVCVIIFTAAAVFFYVNEKSNTISIEEADIETGAEDKGASNAAGKEGDETVYVDVSGCVKKPGVYEVSAASRIFEVIEMAGGITPDADTSYINQAEPVQDGLKINVPEKNSGSVPSRDTPSASQEGSGKININSADREKLEEIPGVGPVTAEKIISYRESNGYFSSIEDIKNVSGIGEKTFDKIKNIISV